MKLRNFVHEPIAILRLLPEDDDDERDLREARDNLSRLTNCPATFVTLQEHPRKGLSIIFTPRKDKLP